MTQEKKSRRSWFGLFGKKKNHVDTSLGNTKNEKKSVAQTIAPLRQASTTTASSSNSHASSQSLDPSAEKQTLQYTLSPTSALPGIDEQLDKDQQTQALAQEETLVATTTTTTPAITSDLPIDQSQPPTLAISPNTATHKELHPEEAKDEPSTATFVSITWEHGGEKVYLTGTFDNWQRTIEMTKLENGTFFHELSSVVLPVEYKFVVDGNWQYDVNQPIKSDNEGNVNNWVHAGLLRH